MRKLHTIEIGQMFGMWKVVYGPIRKGKAKRIYYLCECQCSKHTRREIYNCSLVDNLSTSCGCTHSAILSSRNMSHNMSSSPEYIVWAGMRQRCSNQKHHNYKNYGGRGITVCERWLKFENFYADMGSKPFVGASLDRIDNDRGYSPDNVKWATATEQANNRRNSLVKPSLALN